MLSVCRLLPIYLLFSCSFTCFFFIFITFTCGQSSPLEKKKNNINRRISLFSCFYTWSPIIRLISPNGIPGLSLIRRFRDSLANTRYPQGARADDPRRLFFYWIKKWILLKKILSWENWLTRALLFRFGVDDELRLLLLLIILLLLLAVSKFKWFDWCSSPSMLLAWLLLVWSSTSINEPSSINLNGPPGVSWIIEFVK